MTVDVEFAGLDFVVSPRIDQVGAWTLIGELAIADEIDVLLDQDYAARQAHAS